MTELRLTESPVDPVCIQAACGSNHTVVLCKNNQLDAWPMSVFAFGMNNFGQIDMCTSENTCGLYRKPEKISTLTTTNIYNVSAGGDQSFVVGATIDSSDEVCSDS
jgi:alpha-tubulin suppressor-like RCC1 family protein